MKESQRKYEVVISGMSGLFPESGCVEDFHNNLLNKVNMVEKGRRWEKEPPFEDISNQVGTLERRDYIDMTFFKLSRRLLNNSDPMIRLGMELAVAAVVDAGVNPQELSGTRTAVVGASCISETEYESMVTTRGHCHILLGNTRSMQSNRISFYLNCIGPSLTIESCWNSAIQALAIATDLIERGLATQAIIVIASIIWLPEVSFHFRQMGRLNEDGKTKSFSDNADGYSRSEGCVAFFLQRKEDALRIYGSPLPFPTSFYMEKNKPINEISRNKFSRYLEENYAKRNIDVNTIGYLEANGIASKVIDALELNSIGSLLLKNRKDALPVGSVKSNVGHSEGAASGVALVKVLLAANSGIIPPNIHYSEPNSLVPYLKNGKMKVVTEPAPLKGDLLVLNSFGVETQVAHALVRRHGKFKKREPEVNQLPPDGLPRLFIISGRDETSLLKLLQKVESKPIDEEYLALAYNVFKKGIRNHSYRGFTVLNEKATVVRKTKEFFTGGQDVRPIWFVFTGMGSQWPGMGVDLMKIPIFEKAAKRCHEILKPKGLNLLEIITTSDPKVFDNILHSFVGIAAVQIGLVDVLNELGIKADGIVGHSVGELGCAYADGCFTAEQMILAAYARGRASLEADLIPGMMAAVGLGYNQIKDKLPEGIEVACHNSATSCTLSGPAELMDQYIKELQSRAVFARLVNVANIAYHSRYIRPAAPALLNYLEEVVPEPKLRSSKWISSSVPEKDWDKESAKYCSAEYHTNNLLGSVLFEEASKHIPSNAVIVEIAPHGLLQAILKKAFTEAVHIPLTNRTHDDGLIHLVEALGKLYLEGVEMNIEKLYPPVEFPVSSGTRPLDDLLTWDHSEKWDLIGVFLMKDYVNVKCKEIDLDPETKELRYILDHKIHDLSTIPLALYMDHIFKHYCIQPEERQNKCIHMRNIHLEKHLEISEGKRIYVTLGMGTGVWEFTYDNELLAAGQIDLLLKPPKRIGRKALGVEVSKEEIYKYLSHMGQNLGPAFRLIKSVTMSTTEVSGLVTWDGNLTSFLDAVLKLPALLSMGDNKLYLVSRIKEFILDTSKFNTDEEKDILVYYNSHTEVLECDGLFVLWPRSSHVAAVDCKPDKTIVSQVLQSVPYDFSDTNNEKEILERSLAVFFDNIYEFPGYKTNATIIEVKDNINLQNKLSELLNWKDSIKVGIKEASTDITLDGYAADLKNNYCFIISASKEIKNSLKMLKDTRGGFLLCIGNLPSLPSDMTVIFSKKLGNVHYTLCKLKNDINENEKYVSMASADWKEQVIKLLEKNTNERIFLVGSITSLAGIYTTSRLFNELPNSHLLRFIFMEIDKDKFQPNSIKGQLEKDLKINIYSDGKWGLCLLLPKSYQVENETALISAYKFSDLRIKGGSAPQALGINYTDSPRLNSKVDVFEYSGKILNEDVCGIGRFSESTREIIPDPIFSWKRPKCMSHEEAVSSLLNYTMAYYMIDGEYRTIHGGVNNSVLVNQGTLPISQAVINVALSLKLTVFITYREEKEKKVIMQMFPSIPECNIFCYDDDFGIKLLSATMGNGVNTVVNTLGEKKYLEPSLSCLTPAGIFYQLGEKVMEKNDTMGLAIFLRSSTVIGVVPDTILELPDELKHKIQSVVGKGLENGTLKPLPRMTFSSEETNIHTLSILSQPEYATKKAIVSFKQQPSEAVSVPFLCNETNSYVIIGNVQWFWLDLVEWLAKRGAKNAYIFNNESTPRGIPHEKLQHLLQVKYPKLKCVFPNESILQDRDSINLFLQEINATGKLDSVFVIGEVHAEITENVLSVFINDKVVLMNENAIMICQKRFDSGLPTLAITLPHYLLSSHGILPKLDQLLQENSQNVFISEECLNRKIDVDVEGATFFSHLPSSVDDLLKLKKLSDVAYWKETRSSSPGYSNYNEVPPVFVIPPLKANQMDKLIKYLYSPVFLATFPKNVKDFEKIALQLYQDIKRFEFGVFTIICSDWSWPAGFALGKLLEKDSKRVCLVFFESSVNWGSSTSYQQVINAVKKDLFGNSENFKQSEKLSLKVQDALGRLKYLLSLYETKLPSTVPKIRGICHYIRTNQVLKHEQLDKLQEYCEQPINIFTAEEIDYHEMMESLNVANHVNACVLTEHRDAAREVNRPYIKNSFFPNHRR